jgi:hypothetical protein
MHTKPRIAARLAKPLLLLCAMTLVAAWRIGPPLTFFEDKGAIAKSVAEIAAAGQFSRVLSIQISPQEIQIEAQDPVEKRHVNRWRLLRMNVSQFNWEARKGPEPVALSLIDPNFEANLFDLAEVDFSEADKLIKDALARTALEDATAVVSMELRRQVILLPKPSSGDVRWTVNVRSDRETASVIANSNGRVVGLDLGGTNRARMFDLLSALEMLPEAALAFEQGVGGGPILVKARISSHGITFQTNLTEKSALMASLKERQTYTWNLSGLSRSFGSFDTSEFFGADPAFSIKDTDWSLAPALVSKAREALGMAAAKLAEIEVFKPKDQPGTPQLEWEITLVDGNDKGIARFNAKGEAIGTMLPESRRKPFDGRAPATWPTILSELAKSFGGEGAIAEMTLYDKHVSIVALDPQNPKDLGQFLLTEDGVTRFGTVSPFAVTNPRFSVADLKALDVEQMGKLQDATAKRLGIPASKITIIAIGKASMDPSPDGNVTVEIHAEEAPFGRGGRVNWEIDGREIKAYLP